MTPEEFAARMTEISILLEATNEIAEPESHGMMDDLMCNVLCSLGYSAGVRIFKETPKWYE